MLICAFTLLQVLAEALQLHEAATSTTQEQEPMQEEAELAVEDVAGGSLLCTQGTQANIPAVRKRSKQVQASPSTVSQGKICGCQFYIIGKKFEFCSYIFFRLCI